MPQELLWSLPLPLRLKDRRICGVFVDALSERRRACQGQRWPQDRA